MKGKIGAVGMFDGVHAGHRYLLGQLISHALRLGLIPVAITFKRHPLEELHSESAPSFISTPAQRTRLLNDEGVEVLVFEFKEIKHLTAAQFLDMLKGRGFRALIMGFNNHIGCDRLDVKAAEALGILEIIPCAAAPGGEEVSSTAVRAALKGGDMEAVMKMLGHPFRLAGIVEHGQQLGRTIGFPTANIKPAQERQQQPAPGVYAVLFRHKDKTYAGMANLGTRPTVNGAEPTLEVNIFDFQGNLYGEEVEVEFIERMRPERRFPSVEALRAQLERDRIQALSLLKKYL